MRICLLTNQDLDAVPFPRDDWPCDPRPYLPEADWHVACLRKATSVEQVSRLIGKGFDLFFNLCDGAAGQDTPGIEVVRTLEAHGVAFTGATSAFYEPTREAMKQACRAEGIAAPRECSRAMPPTSSARRRRCAFRCSSSTTTAIRASTSRGARACARPRACASRRARSCAATAPR
jgi:hypothetical protein